MFDSKSSYALNKKDSDAIIYKDAYGSITRLTVSDFGSIKEFRKWKNWAKMKGYTEEKKEHIHRNHTVSMTGFEELLNSIPSSEENTDQQEHSDSNQQNSMLEQIKSVLTETQFRRLWMYEALGKSMEEIAVREGVSITAVFYSIQSAHKKSEKIFQLSLKHLKNSPSNRR